MKIIIILSFAIFFVFSKNSYSGTATIGDDILYGVKSTSGSTQDFGTIDPTNGSFTTILQIVPSGLGWPLGDMGSEPDPILGEVYSRQTNPNTSSGDILAIKKSDGTTRWLGTSGIVVGFDTNNNKLIIDKTESGVNNLGIQSKPYAEKTNFIRRTKHAIKELTFVYQLSLLKPC